MADTYVLCVFSNKGGSGKPTISVHLAYAKLAKTALLDADSPRNCHRMAQAPLGRSQEPSRHAVRRAGGGRESAAACPLGTGRVHPARSAAALERADRLALEGSGSDPGADAAVGSGPRHHQPDGGPGAAARRPAGFIPNALRPQQVEAREIALILAAAISCQSLGAWATGWRSAAGCRSGSEGGP